MKQPESLRTLADKSGLLLGTCVNSHALQDDPLYARIIAQEFNLITPENAMKFAPLSRARGEYDFSNVDKMVSFATEHNLQVRGHVLVWDYQLPAWLLKGSYSRGELIDILQEHVTTVVSRYAGRIAAWDVVNEAVDDDGSLRQTFWTDQIGPDYIEIAFRAAREADPAARLFYNDLGAEGTHQHRDGVYSLLADLKDKGVPVDGLGFQMHLSLDKIQHQTGELLDTRRLSDLGLEFNITELDIRMRMDQGSLTADRTRQAAAYSGIFHDYVLEKGCDTFVLWGFTDRYSWIPFFYPGEGEATIMTDKYEHKPAYRSLIAALKKMPQKIVSPI